MSSFSKFVATIVRDGNDGKQFEKFVKWFLVNDPYWATQVENVWLWKEYPDRWHHDDQGIDLVFQHKNGETWAVQAKCFNPKYYVPRDEIDSFLSESSHKLIHHRLLIASTDKLGKNTERVIYSQEKPVTKYLRSDFERSRVVFPSSSRLPRTKKAFDRPTPHPYQKDAINEIARGFKEADRGQLIMACGTGKTLVSLWTKERLRSKRTLVLVPSLALLSQAVNEWTYAARKQFEVLCVCSDSTVGQRKRNDEFIQSVSELPFPVSSEKGVIAKFLRGNSDMVLFSTYQSTPILVDVFRYRRAPSFDLAIADEAHRCVSQKGTDSAFINILSERKIRAKNRLFTTATPRTFSIQVTKAAEKRGVSLRGMDDEELFGKPFFRLPFGDCIRAKPSLLTDYKLVVVGIDDATLAKWVTRRELVRIKRYGITADAESIAFQVGLIKAISGYGLRRVISFHNRVEAARAFSESLAEVQGVLRKAQARKITISADYISGSLSSSDRNAKIETLESIRRGQSKLLANARCLQEGVDIPTLDGIAFIDPRNSPIDIVQAVGRAIRLSKRKKLGYIVLPIFLEKGKDLDLVARSGPFAKLWTVVNALKAHDEMLSEELEAARVHLGRRSGRTRGGISFDKIVLDLPKSMPKKWANQISTHLVEVTTETWWFWFGLLESYVSEHGDSRVPESHETKDGLKLGVWVGTQRQRSERLTKVQRHKLESLPDWTWDILETLWEEGFQHLEEYVAKFGTALVPNIYLTECGFNLGQWVQVQRVIWASRKKRKTTRGQKVIAAKRTRRLKALDGWVWNVSDYEWQTGIEHLDEYIREFGNARTPATYICDDGFVLGRWVVNVRRRPITRKRRRELSARSGWVWHSKDADWEECFEEYTRYLESYSNPTPPPSYKTRSGRILRHWVSNQRVKEEELKPIRRRRLDALKGWVWDIAEYEWEKGFQYLKKFLEEVGHARPLVAFRTKDGFKLGQWVSMQRTRRKHMGREQRTRLESLKGWAWNVMDAKWEEGFEDLQCYVATFDHARVPAAYVSPSGYNLGNWVTSQRPRKKTMSAARRKRLNSVKGWVWNAVLAQKSASDDEGLKILKAYVKEFKTARAPTSYCTKDGFALGIWIAGCRLSYRKKTLSAKMIKELERLKGWVWTPKHKSF